MSQLMKRLERWWTTNPSIAWLRKHWKLIGGALAGLGAIIVGVLVWGSYNRQVATVKDAVKVEKAKVEIAELRGRRQELLNQDRETEAEVQEVDDALTRNQEAIREARQRAEVKDDDLAREFAALGF